ncbi:MAG: aminotransferase class IV [Marinilabiliaceae bacterium]|nr:aminotransferase class IV [Marinilabiliaceae bacterium]
MEALLNNKLVNVKNNHSITNGIIIYDAMRVQNGVVLFTEDHFKRLLNSISIAKYIYTSNFVEWEQRLYKLINHHNLLNGNIRVEISFYNNNQFNELIQIYDTKYPTPEDYNSGVIAKLQFDERSNPNAKIANLSARIHAEDIIKNENVYETILVNSNNYITEGSRTNIFALLNNQLYTAPDDMVLPGIMRIKTIEAANRKNIPVVFKALNISQLNRVDGMFFTGTSPRVLPIKQIDSLIIPVNNIITSTILTEIEIMITDYIEQKNETLKKKPIK